MTKHEPSKDGLLRGYEPVIAMLQRAADAVWIILGQYIACVIHDEQWRAIHTVAAAVAVITFHLAAEANGLYRSWRGSPIRLEAFRVAGTWIIVAALLLFAAFVTKKSEEYSRFITMLWFGITPTLLVIWRVSVRLCLQEVRRRGRNSRTVAIAGMTPMAERLVRRVQDDPWLGMHIKGFYDDRHPDRRHAMAKDMGPFAGDLDQLVEDAKAGTFDLVYITLPLRAEPRINSVVRRLADTTASVYVVADFFVFDLLHAQWSSVGDIPVVSIFDTPFSGVGGWVKRLEDIVLASLILLLISVPMAIIAAAVKLTSPGPVFFVQRRYGLNGREIRVLKFRTMSVCEDGGNVQQAQRNDPRVTKIGAFLRRTSLDELPQFINVLLGNMSIVGPRPHAVSHNELYRSKIQGYMLRHKVKPGITGWAQVNGWRGETDTMEKMEKRIEHDLDYIHNWNLLWDLKIIFMTVFGSKKSENAY